MLFLFARSHYQPNPPSSFFLLEERDRASQIINTTLFLAAPNSHNQKEKKKTQRATRERQIIIIKHPPANTRSIDTTPPDNPPGQPGDARFPSPLPSHPSFAGVHFRVPSSGPDLSRKMALYKAATSTYIHA